MAGVQKDHIHRYVRGHSHGISYLESMIPVNIAVPGIKLGLANMVTIVVMYRLRISDAWIVSLVRVVLSSLLFGNMTVMVYSMAGAVLSLLVMTLCRKRICLVSLERAYWAE